MNKRRRFKAKRRLGKRATTHPLAWPQRFAPCVLIVGGLFRHHVALGLARAEIDARLRDGVD